jgi:thiamine biosynthesis lipoprotein ApbE
MIFVLGLKDGLELLESTLGADGLFVTKAGRVTRTSGFSLDRMQTM